MLALGDRRSVLTFKRAVDAGVDLSPIATRLFDPDFKLAKWLDSQGVPPPVLGVSREGAVAIKKATYTERTRTSPPPDKPQGLIEAILVPVAPPKVKALLKETYLSQTSIVTIGRAEGMSLTVGHSSISRRHAEIVYANGRYALRDLQSKNGTFVNDQRLDAETVVLLKPGDTVKFGDVSFAFQTRKVDPSASMLLSKHNLHLLSNGVIAGNVAPISAKVSPQNGNAPAKTSLLQNASPIAPSALGQPMQNTDGSVFFPEASSPLPATIVATMRETPALVAIMQGRPEVFLLKQGKNTTIGRDKENPVVLADISISRRHAELLPGPDGIYIRDLESSNGVLVNQTRIDNPYRLSHGDRITIGNVIIYFVDQHPQYGAVAPGASSPPASHKQCPRCGSENSSVARFCQMCAAPL